MKRHLITFFSLCFFCTALSAATWSFSGGYLFFDNSQTQWEDPSLMLIIGKSSYSSVYELMADTMPNRYYCKLPSSGWGDATYMAIIGGNTVWGSGAWGPDNLPNATHYTATYTAGLSSAAQQAFLLTPQTAGKGCSIKLTYLGDSYTDYCKKTFSTEEKNRCYAISPKDSTVTFIFSTSNKRFNIPESDITRVYVYGSITMWSEKNEPYRLNRLSDDGCLYRTLPFSMLDKIGSSGQPEFIFWVQKKDGSEFAAHHNAGWGDYFDKRYLFVNNSENMVVAMPGDDINEIYERCLYAQHTATLSDFNFSSTSDQLRIANFRRVPGTRNLYRSYHPYSPSHQQYETEERRLHYVAKCAEKAGIRSDIALSGDETKSVGKTYTCGGKQYTVTMPDYYQKIIDNGNVLYVGTRNGHTPDFNTALYESDGARFAEWIQEVVEFILDDAHPVPFEIHCAIGADRTGAFSETLGALCDATWDELARDYSATSEMRIQEYRHINMMRKCIKNMCGVDPATNPSFNEAVKRHFIEGGYLRQSQIDSLKLKLNQPDTLRYSVVVPDGTRQCYIAADWSNWERVRMNRVDDTHYTYWADYANASQGYKYLAGTEWIYEEYDCDGQRLTANRTYALSDTVCRWAKADTTIESPVYTDITVRAYSPLGPPLIWWFGGGDRVRSSSMLSYTFSSRPLMLPVNDDAYGDYWYEWQFKDVDSALGLSYILTTPDNVQSDDLLCFSSECRDASYRLIDCPSTPTGFFRLTDSLRNAVYSSCFAFVQNSHLYIFRNGELYNAQGQHLK
ncbi:MAG: tyrosine-protein phosphatase [Paludibacteraceae bacterium]|nr:tyrosine-protein phosphatase [Paludibacteraceae bacterium]